MKSRELLLTTPLFNVARLRFEALNGGEIVRDVIEHPGPQPQAYTLEAFVDRYRENFGPAPELQDWLGETGSQTRQQCNPTG